MLQLSLQLVPFTLYLIHVTSAEMKGCADLTAICVLTIITTKQPIIEIFIGNSACLMRCSVLPLKRNTRIQRQTQTVATVKTRPGFSFLSHRPTANFQKFQFISYRVITASWSHSTKSNVLNVNRGMKINVCLTAAQSVSLLLWRMRAYFCWRE